MAKQGNKTQYISKGSRKNVASSTLAGMKADRHPSDKEINKQKAWIGGSNPWVTIKNPNKTEVDKPFIRVKMNTLKGGSYKDVMKKVYPV